MSIVIPINFLMINCIEVKSQKSKVKSQKSMDFKTSIKVFLFYAKLRNTAVSTTN